MAHTRKVAFFIVFCSIFALCTADAFAATTCSQGEYYSALQDNCVSCPDGLNSTSGATCATDCFEIDEEDPQHSQYFWELSVKCDIGFYLPRESETCAPCPEGYRCPGKTTQGGYRYRCDQDSGLTYCGENKGPNADHTACIDIPGTSYSSVPTCNSGEYSDYDAQYGTYSCRKCPHPFEKSDAGADEITDCYYTKASGEKVKYSRYGQVGIWCSDGKYLPKNSYKCNAACNQGCTCTGGKFYMNGWKNQGIVCTPGGGGNGGGSGGGGSGGGSSEWKDGYYYFDSQYGYIKCQAGFQHSDTNASSRDKCYDYDTKNRKMYYKYIDGTGTESNPKTCVNTGECTKCSDNTYVKKGTNWCSACPDGKICSGGWFLPSMQADLGISDKDSHGCRIGGTGSIQNGQYWTGSECKNCPNDFFLADPEATSRDQCYKKLSGNNKLYYKKYHCDAGQYLPKASSQCASCLDGYYCTQGDYYPNLKEAQGLKTCEDGKVPNTTKTACETSSGGGNGAQCANASPTGTTTCAPGKYLPACNGKDRCEACSGSNKYCPGGQYQYPVPQDQGVKFCPQHAIANNKHDACIFKFQKNYLKTGPNGAQTPLSDQCWLVKDTKGYAKCMFPNGTDGLPKYVAPAEQTDIHYASELENEK